MSPDGTMMAAGFDPTIGRPEGCASSAVSDTDRVRQQPSLRGRQERRALSCSDRSRSASHRRHGLAGVARPVNGADHGFRRTQYRESICVHRRVHIGGPHRSAAASIRAAHDVFDRLVPRLAGDLPAHASRLEVGLSEMDAAVAPREARFIGRVIERSPGQRHVL